jgi:hypothetical protein
MFYQLGDFSIPLILMIIIQDILINIKSSFKDFPH